MTTTIIAQLTSTIIVTILISKRRNKNSIYNSELYNKYIFRTCVWRTILIILLPSFDRIELSSLTIKWPGEEEHEYFYIYFLLKQTAIASSAAGDKKSSLDGGRKIAAGTGAIAALPSSSSSYRLISIETPFCNCRPAMAAASHPEEPQNEPSELWRPLLTATACTLLLIVGVIEMWQRVTKKHTRGGIIFKIFKHSSSSSPAHPALHIIFIVFKSNGFDKRNFFFLYLSTGF